MQYISKTLFALAIGTLGLLAHAPPAGAATILENDELTVDLNGLGEVGLGFESPDPHAEGLRTDLRLARLKTDARLQDWGGFKLQVDARSGRFELLDLLVDITPTDWLTLRAGRFKVPVSREYLIGAPDMRFTNRALARRIAPGREVGLQLVAEQTLGQTDAELSAGLFEPGGVEFLQNDGELLVGRLLLEFPHHLEFHAAYAEHILSDNRVPLPEDPARSRRVFPDDRQLDAAVGFHDDHWHLLLEGLTALDAPTEQVPLATHASVAYRAPVDGIDLEPALAYDLLDRSDHRIHRGAAALNLYWLDTDLMTTLEYEAELESSHLTHAVTLLLQAGF
jgi:hypothetical protein